MTIHKRVLMCVIGDIIAMFLISALVPWALVKIVLLLVVVADLYTGLVIYAERYTTWGHD